ncbi:MAG: dipicolinate synthase subunit B [Clostridia bacterium]|nr:dipicolinate synthase subunit B [Clostridia bacterium]
MTDLRGVRVGCAMTGSFCTFARAFRVWRALREAGAELTPIMSFNAANIDTRFFEAAAARQLFEEICGKPLIQTIAQAEPIGPKKLLDVLAIMPCTGNTLAKLAAGVADTPVTLAAKSHLRNGRPVVLAVSSNDALGQNARNIGQLMAAKHFFFAPLRQDDPGEKPGSIVADFEMLPETLAQALEGRQIQPMIGK